MFRQKLHGSMLAPSSLIMLSILLTADAMPSSKLRQQAQAPRARRATPYRITKAFVVDERLSALRRQPDLHSTVTRRLHLGHKVWIIGERAPSSDQPHFYRIAVSRRTRGWIHAAALLTPARKNEDLRLFDIINGSSDGFERIARCRLFSQNFARSPLMPRVLLTMAEEAERAAAVLSKRSTRRLVKANTQEIDVNERDYYLTDAGLDRYSRIGVDFDFSGAPGKYAYDGHAYRDIIARYPQSEAADAARKHLERPAVRLAKRP